MAYPFLPVNPCCTDVVLNSPCGCSSTVSNNCNNNLCGTNVTLSSNVIYNGPALDCIIAEPCDTLNVVLQKIDEIICNLLQQINTLNIQVANITQQIINIQGDIIIINNTLDVCCNATTTTTTTAEPTTTTTTSSSSTTSSTTSTTSSTTSTSSTTTSTTTATPTTTTTTTAGEVYSGNFSAGKDSVGLACLETTAVMTLYSSDPTFGFGSFVYTDIGLTTPFIGGTLFYKNISANNGIKTSGIGQINSTFSCP
jgi:hypothetical protein